MAGLNPNAKEFAFTGGRKGNVAVYKASITDDLKGALQSSHSGCNSCNTSTKSSNLPNRRNKDPDMRVCQSIEELTQIAYEHIRTMSPRGMSAFWSSVAQLLRKSRFEKVQNDKQMNLQLEEILGHTLQDINTFGYRDLAQTALGLAKIVKHVSGADGKSISRFGSPQRVLYDLITGDNSSNKEFIFKVLAEQSMVLLHKFDSRSLSNLIYAYGLARCVIKFEDDGSTLFDVFAQAAIPNLHTFNGQDLSNMLWAYANVKVSNSQLFKKIGDHIVQLDNLDEFWPQALSNILWAYATLDEQHPELFKKVADHIVELNNLNDFWPQALKDLVWAYATAKKSHPEIFKKIADHIVQLPSLDKFESQHLSITVWALATAEERHPQLFKKVADHIITLDLDRFDPQHLSNIVWAFATAKEQHPKLYKKIADHITGLDNLDKYKPEAISIILWSFATAGESHPQLFKKMADHIVQLPNLNEFNEQNLSNTVWAFATAEESNPQLFNKLADEAIKRQHEFNPQDISNFLWSFATNGQVDEHLFSSLISSVKENLDKYNKQELSNIAWAYSVSNVDAPSIFNNKFITACLRKEDEFELEALLQFYQWQLWQEEIKSNISLPSPFQKRCHQAFISQEISPSTFQDDVVSILSSIGIQPQEEVLLKSGYRIDAVVEVNGRQIAVEVDGPSHFIGRDPIGKTILKHRQVAALDGMKVVSIPYWEWDKLEKDSNKKEEYLRGLLEL